MGEALVAVAVWGLLAGEVLMIPWPTNAWQGELRGVALLLTGPTGSGGTVLADASTAVDGEVLTMPECPARPLDGVLGPQAVAPSFSGTPK